MTCVATPRRAFMALVLVWALAALPCPSVPAAEACPVEVVFCLDATELAFKWDSEGVRPAAVLFADALLPQGAKRSLLVFSFKARPLMNHEETPLARRPEPANPELSLSYAMDHPYANLPDPAEPLIQALDILDRADSPAKAIFLLLGNRLQRAADPNDPLAALGAKVAARCRLQGTRLFVAHRDAAPVMAEFWSEVAGATGGAAVYVAQSRDMVDAAADWAASLTGLFAVQPSQDVWRMKVRKGQRYALIFDAGAETADLIANRIRGSRFESYKGEAPVIRGSVGLLELSALENGEFDLPVPAQRVRRVYTRVSHRASISISPDIVTASQPWTARVWLDSSETLPGGSVAVLQEVNASGAPTDGAKRIEPLTVRHDPSRNGDVYEARFASPTPARAYRLSFGPEKPPIATERLVVPLKVYDETVRSIVRQAPGSMGATRIVLRATLDKDAAGNPRVVAAFAREGAALQFADVPAESAGFTAQIAPSYRKGDVYRVVVGALGARSGGVAYLPGQAHRFPEPANVPPIRTPGAATQAARVTPSATLAAPAATLAAPAATRGTPAAIAAAAHATSPVAALRVTTAPAIQTAALPAALRKDQGREASPAQWAALVLGSVAVFGLALLTVFFGKRAGFFPGRLEAFQALAGAGTAGGAYGLPEEATLVMAPGEKKADGASEAGSTLSPGREPEKTLRDMLATQVERPQLSEEDLLRPPTEAFEKGQGAGGGALARAKQTTAPTKADDAREEETDRTDFTEQDLEKTLKKTQFAPEDHERPKRKDVVDQHAPLRKGDAEKAGEAQGQEPKGGEGEAAEPAPSGYLSQDDLEALLSQAEQQTINVETIERGKNGDPKS